MLYKEFEIKRNNLKIVNCNCVIHIKWNIQKVTTINIFELQQNNYDL